MRVHLDKIGSSVKPSDSEIARIKYGLTDQATILDLSVEEIVSYLCNSNGRTIQPGVTPFTDASMKRWLAEQAEKEAEAKANGETYRRGLPGTRDDDWVEQTLFMLDVDNDKDGLPTVTYKEAEALLAEHNLDVAFGYPTFSSGLDNPRFRLALVSAETFTDRAERDRVQTALCRFFPQADQRCTNGDRIFFGTNKAPLDVGDLKATCTKEDLLKFADWVLAAWDVLEGPGKLPSKLPDKIPRGQRHNTMVTWALGRLTRWGDTDEARAAFDEGAARCDPPLPQRELDRIYSDMRAIFHTKVETDPNYKSAAEYSALQAGKTSKRPVTCDDVRATLEAMEISVRLNVISGRMEIEGMPEQYSRANSGNVLPMLLYDVMRQAGLKPNRSSIDEYLLAIADEHRFNPVRLLLDETVWDGTDRLADLYSMLGLKDGDTGATYLRKWLHQCVALALNDEAQPYGADGVLVLQGEQGMGKTLFFRRLAVAPALFAEGVSIDMAVKDTIIQATGVWIAELGELDSTLRREQSQLKAFLTQSLDRYRPPYARAEVNRPRRTSFCATVNPDQFLNDDSGSRRYWVVKLDSIDLDGVKGMTRDWIVQLWRQVYERFYRADPQGFRLTEDERRVLLGANKAFEKMLPGETELMDRLDFDLPVKWWEWLKVSEVLEAIEVRGVTASQLGRVLAKLAKQDDRVQVKNPGNVKRYLLPPVQGRADVTERRRFEA